MNTAFSERQLRSIFDSLSAHIVIIDDSGDIIDTNAAWRKFSEENGGPAHTVYHGMNYLNVCTAAEGEDARDAKAVETGIRQIIKGEVKEFLYDYPCHSPEGPRWFYMRAMQVEGARPLRVIISHEDITALKLAQNELKLNQEALEDKNQSLEEANIALKVLLEQREKDKEQMETKILSNVKTFVQPYIRKLSESRLSEKDKTLVRILDDHLKEIVSPMMRRFSHADIMLTPQELQVASLVRDGRTTSEIADILFVTEATVSFHRKNIRNKLGLKSRRSNLRSFLLSMS